MKVIDKLNKNLLDVGNIVNVGDIKTTESLSKLVILKGRHFKFSRTYVVDCK